MELAQKEKEKEPEENWEIAVTSPKRKNWSNSAKVLVKNATPAEAKEKENDLNIIQQTTK